MPSFSPLARSLPALLLALLILLPGCRDVPPATPTPGAALPSLTPPAAAPPAASPTARPAPPLAQVSDPTLTPVLSAPPPPEALTPTADPGLPLPTPFPTITPDRARTLDAQGPWLLVRASTGLWAANSDGTGLTQLTRAPMRGPQNLARAASPDGRRVAFLTTDADGLRHPRLIILTLPEALPEMVINLTGAHSELPRDALPGEPAFEAIRAIVDIDSLAWSPDGRTLAFIAAINGPSADLYTYTPATARIAQLTDGPAQGYGPVWSPDGRWIVHFGVDTFGTGAGYSMAGAWAARADGSGVMDLYRPGSSGEELIGWLNNSQFVAYGWTPVCGPTGLSAVTLGGETQTLAAGCFSGAAMTPWGEILLTGDENAARPGVSLLRQEAGGQWLQVTPRRASSVVSLAGGPDFLVTHPDRQAVYNNNGDLLAESPGAGCAPGFGVAGFGLIYAWSCAGDPSGVWINGPGLEERRVFTAPAELPAFGYDNTLLFFSAGRLFAAPFLDYTPVEMGRLEGDLLDVAWLREP